MCAQRARVPVCVQALVLGWGDGTRALRCLSHRRHRGQTKQSPSLAPLLNPSLAAGLLPFLPPLPDCVHAKSCMHMYTCRGPVSIPTPAVAVPGLCACCGAAAVGSWFCVMVGTMLHSLGKTLGRQQTKQTISPCSALLIRGMGGRVSCQRPACSSPPHAGTGPWLPSCWTNAAGRAPLARDKPDAVSHGDTLRDAGGILWSSLWLGHKPEHHTRLWGSPCGC